MEANAAQQHSIGLSKHTNDELESFKQPKFFASRKKRDWMSQNVFVLFEITLYHILLLLFPNNTCAIDLIRGWSATPPVNHSSVFSCSKSNQREEKVHHFWLTTRNLYCSFCATMLYGVADELWFLLKKIAEVNIIQQKHVNLYFVNMSYFLQKIGFKKNRWIDS